MASSLMRLVIDSATEYLYLALYENLQKRDSVYLKGDNNHSETLMVELKRLLEQQGVRPQNLDEIYVGVGPGSYTGVRIGVVVAKILAYSLNIPVYTISSLTLLASSEKSPLIVPYIDARRGYVFASVMRCQEGILTTVNDDAYCNFEELKATVDGTYICAGEPDFAVIYRSQLFVRVDNLHHLAPVYLRKTEAETNLNKG